MLCFTPCSTRQEIRQEVSINSLTAEGQAKKQDITQDPLRMEKEKRCLWTQPGDPAQSERACPGSCRGSSFDFSKALADQSPGANHQAGMVRALEGRGPGE